MSKISKITQKISGVKKSRDATSDTRQLLMDSAEFEEDPVIRERYIQCASCDRLKEEFRLFGIVIKDQTPVCAECGCCLMIKIPMHDMSCPLELW